MKHALRPYDQPIKERQYIQDPVRETHPNTSGADPDLLTEYHEPSSLSTGPEYEFRKRMEQTMERVDIMRKQLETVVRLSFWNNDALRGSDSERTNNYLRVFGILQTMKGLQERLAEELATGRGETATVGRRGPS